MLKKSFLIIAVLAMFSYSCKERVRGSGIVVNATRNLDMFDEVDYRCEGKIIFTQGHDASFKIITDDNLLPLIETEVSRGKLKIYSVYNIVRFTDLTIEIVNPELKAVSISGSGEFDMNEILLTEELKLNVSGSGDINMNANTESLEAKLSGSGEINVKGSAEDIECKISGSGKINAHKMNCEEATVKISGSGNCTVNASEDLSVKISGSGNVYYFGNPDISTKVSGSGGVFKKN